MSDRTEDWYRLPRSAKRSDWWRRCYEGATDIYVVETPQEETAAREKADWWTVVDAANALEAVYANRWDADTRELLYVARQAVWVLVNAMREEESGGDKLRLKKEARGG